MRHPVLTKNYNGYWYVIYWKAGRRRKISTKERDNSKAKEFFSRFLANDLQREEPVYVMVSEVFREFMEAKKPYIAEKTLKSYGNALSQFLIFLPDRNINQITRDDISGFISEKLTNRTAYTAKKYRNTLKSAFDYAVRRKYIKSNPVVIERIQLPPVKIRYYREGELERLLEVIDNELYRDIALFAYYTGARLGEVLSIKKCNVFIEDSVAVLETSKNHQPRVIGLSQAAVEIAVRYMASPDEYLFTYQGRQCKVNTVSHIFAKYKRRAGLDKELNFHSLRKTTATALRAKGASLEAISGILGHSSTQVTRKHYAAMLKMIRPEIELIEKIERADTESTKLK